MTEIQICFSYKLSIGVLLQQFFFLLLFLTLHYGMVKNVLSPDLTGKLPWPALMGQLQLPLSLQQGRIPQCQKLPCSRHCEVGYNCFTVGFGFVCLFGGLGFGFFFPSNADIVVKQDCCVVKCWDRGYCLVQHL